MSTKNPKKWLSTLVPTIWQNRVSKGLFQKVTRNLYLRFWKKERKNEGKEIDEDKYFLLSLLPWLKKFNEDQKFVARMQIMNVIRHVLMSGSLATTNLNTGNSKFLDTAIWTGANSTPSISSCGGSFTSIRQSETFPIQQDSWHVLQLSSFWLSWQKKSMVTLMNCWLTVTIQNFCLFWLCTLIRVCLLYFPINYVNTFLIIFNARLRTMFSNKLYKYNLDNFFLPTLKLLPTFPLVLQPNACGYLGRLSKVLLMSKVFQNFPCSYKNN